MNKVLCCLSYVYFICVYQQHDRSLPTAQGVLANNTIGANQRHYCKNIPFCRHYINFLTEVVDDSLKKLPIGQTKRQYGRGTKKDKRINTTAIIITIHVADWKINATKSS